MTDYALQNFDWLDEEEELDLKLDDYHTVLCETALQQRGSQSKRRSIRRNLSLSTITQRHDSATARAAIPSTNTTSALSQLKPALSPTVSFFPNRHRSHASLSSIDPNASHYQDPAARLKLRVYLASPQKFDEALEFGFPSLQKRNLSQVERIRTSSRPSNEPGRTFFSDYTPSLSGDEEDGMEERDLSLDDPRTPSDSTFRSSRHSRTNSMNGQGTIRAHVVRGITEQYVQTLASDREMTLHMTLTRPDLRSPEEEMKETPANINALPMEQAQLECLSDPAAIWDTLPLEESKMKKLFKRLRLK